MALIFLMGLEELSRIGLLSLVLSLNSMRARFIEWTPLELFDMYPGVIFVPATRLRDEFDLIDHSN